MLAEKMKRIALALLLLAAALAPAAAQDIKVTALPQQKLPVAAGQYSGITFLSGDRYAVVDDKLPGGGIVFFDIPLRENGTVKIHRVKRTVPVSTVVAEVDGLDNEGIVCAKGKLYVSAEADQSIREYDMDGYPTGCSFAVPADLGADAIVGNGGFEPLAYNEVTGKFWTTTELPLKADTEIPHLHRLQRFDAAHQPDARYLYQMDEPLMPAPEAAIARAYVHGIPALAALDDGRLIVLEREVCVPSGQPQEILSKAFARVKLYVVDPSGPSSGILEKHLLCEFETRINRRISGINVALANYEGMCLGPRLADGRQCLILISDSQAGMSSLAAKLGRKRLTADYIKILLLEY